VSGRVLPVLRLAWRRQSQRRRMLTIADVLQKFFPRRAEAQTDAC